MNYKIKTLVVAMAAMLIAVPAFAGTGIYSESADTSPAFRIYNGDDSAATLVITSAGAGADNTFTVDGNSNTIDGSGNTDTIAEFVAAMYACTNAAGDTAANLGIRIDTDCSFTTDSTDGELLTGTYVAAADGGVVEVPWDTSAALHYSVYIPAQDADSIMFRDINPGGNIVRIIGLPTGTSNLTTTVYLDRVAVFAQTDETDETSEVINLNTETLIPFKSSQNVIVRAARTTAATTGNLSVVVDTP